MTEMRSRQWAERQQLIAAPARKQGPGWARVGRASIPKLPTPLAGPLQAKGPATHPGHPVAALHLATSQPSPSRDILQSQGISVAVQALLVEAVCSLPCCTGQQTAQRPTEHESQVGSCHWSPTCTRHATPIGMPAGRKVRPCWVSELNRPESQATVLQRAQPYLRPQFAC